MKFATLIFAVFLASTVRGQVGGKMINESKAEIPYGSIAVRNGMTGYTADSVGQFSLPEITHFPVTLEFSAVGYKTQLKTIPAAGADYIITLETLFRQDTIVVTSRRRSERLQDIPIAVSVLSGSSLEESGAFNVNRVKEIIPSVQLYSSNPRNTGINIRGLGAPFGLTNDGLDPGVGFYVDGVYYARPAAAALDFVDVERMEILRGPQGTLFGKNSTAGALNITTRKPLFSPEARFELSYGNYGFVQAKSSVTGPLSRKLAARLSFSGTQRDGVLKNIRTGKNSNDINNLGLHAQLLYKPSAKTSLLFSADANRQRPDGYAQVIAGVVLTQRPAFRQFSAIVSDLQYSLPSANAFDRIIDHDTPWNSDNDLGGASLTTEIALGAGTLSSTSAWRFWNWNPSNDRDFTGLQALSKSQNPSRHQNWSQEFRYAGRISSRLSGVAGIFLMGQEITTNGTEESGRDQWRFVQNSISEKWRTPGLLDGYGARTLSGIRSFSAAFFVNADYEIIPHFHLLPGIRINYDQKDVNYSRTTYGGLQTEDPELIAMKTSVYSDQSFTANASEKNTSYQLTFSYRPSSRFNSFITYSTGFKPIAVNVGGLPSRNGFADTSLAIIRPEYVKHLEFGVKSVPLPQLTINLSVHHTDINDYQTNVQSPQLGVNRGYLSNAEKVNVKGLELEVNFRASSRFTIFGNGSYTDGRYIRFSNAPLPLEETGLVKDGVQVAFKDISGSRLPGISKWAGTMGAEMNLPASFLGKQAKFILAGESFARSEFSSSPSPSRYLNIPGYLLVNARTGYKLENGLTLLIWGRNIFNRNYYEQLLPAGGNTGQYAAVLGDPATWGCSISYTLK